MTESERVELARRLFVDGWSGGSPESPLAFLTDDAVMRDIVGHPGAMVGHEEIVAFFGPVAPNLKVLPEEFFPNDDGVALTWMAYIRVPADPASGHPEPGYLCGEGMSRLEFRDGKVSLEIDYWHGPQGRCDDWEAHFEARRKMTRAELGATTGA